ncbi:MAG: DUF3108 domain-containing protein [Gammaproteobacteria bacterium]|nr:DUF3108 domain-containing protein [Gammaproteobacteria bacterium]
MRWLGALLLLCLALPVGAQSLPASFEAFYEVKKAGLLMALADRRFEQASLVYQSNFRTTGVAAMVAAEDVRETSWLQQSDGLRPTRYQKIRRGDISERIEQTFDWAKGELRISINEQKKQHSLDHLVLDQASFQLRLMQDLAKGERQFSYTIASDSRLKQYSVTLLREETLQLAKVNYRTLVMFADDGKTQTTLWCAPELGFVPIRIAYREKGITFTANMVRYKAL